IVVVLSLTLVGSSYKYSQTGPTAIIVTLGRGVLAVGALLVPSCSHIQLSDELLMFIEQQALRYPVRDYFCSADLLEIKIALLVPLNYPFIAHINMPSSLAF
ncbi:hypothetical protein L249_6033, partial [Ophiocordyceps polyrhachis-furcata BCC 54312]